MCGKDTKDIVMDKGFTLIETLFVLLIIGFLVTIFIAGKELVVISQRNSSYSKIEKIKIAMYTFRNEYGYYPGDIPNATEYWPGQAIKDGDGDGEILWSINETLDESLTAWRHLYLAEMFNENMTGRSTGAAGDTQRHTIGVNLPEAAIENTGYLIRHTNVPPLPADRASDANSFLPITGNYIQWASIWPDVPGWAKSKDTLIKGVLRGNEAMVFDSKFDDGLPYSGKIIGEMGTPANPATVGCTFNLGSPVYYPTNESGKKCRMHFYID